MSDDTFNFDFDFDFDLDFSGGGLEKSTSVSRVLEELEVNRTLEAVPFIEQVKAEGADTPLVRHLTALTLARMGRIVPAIRVLEAAHNESPNAFEHVEVLAAFFALVGERVESVYYAKLATALGRKYPEYALVPKWLASFGVSFMMAAENPIADNAVLLMNDGDYDTAAENFIDAIDLNNDDTRAWQGLIDVNRKRRRPGDSLRAAEALASLDEENPKYLKELCRCQLELGLIDDAWETANKALSAAGPDLDIAGVLPALVRYDGSATLELAQQLSTAWLSLANLDNEPVVVTPRQSEEEPFRVGIVSGQLRSGSEKIAVLSTIEECIGRTAEIYYYANVESEDAVSRRLRRAAVRWRNITRMDDDTVAQIIRNDEIQVLIDLDGFGWGGRPGIAARRPTPVVLCAFGQPGALPGDHPLTLVLGEPDLPGVTAGDPRSVVIGEGLSTWPLYVKPSVDASRQRTGRILIDGPISRLSSQYLSDIAVATDAGAKGSIVLRGDALDDPIALEQLAERCKSAGMNLAAIERVSGLSDLEQIIDGVDIVLDTWPMPSTEAAFTALRYGVPVITRISDNPANATVSSLLRSLGLHAFVAKDREEVTDLVARLTADENALADARKKVAEALDYASGLDVRLKRAREFASLFDELLERAKAEQS